MSYHTCSKALQPWMSCLQSGRHLCSRDSSNPSKQQCHQANTTIRHSYRGHVKAGVTHARKDTVRLMVDISQEPPHLDTAVISSRPLQIAKAHRLAWEHRSGLSLSSILARQQCQQSHPPTTVPDDSFVLLYTPTPQSRSTC